MKRLFFWLLRNYSRTEKERLEIFEVLHEKVSENYYEQTPYGNLYNANIEFIMASPLMKTLVQEERQISIEMTKAGLQKSVSTAVEYLQNEKQ